MESLRFCPPDTFDPILKVIELSNSSSFSDELESLCYSAASRTSGVAASFPNLIFGIDSAREQNTFFEALARFDLWATSCWCHVLLPSSLMHPAVTSKNLFGIRLSIVLCLEPVLPIIAGFTWICRVKLILIGVLIRAFISNETLSNSNRPEHSLITIASKLSTTDDSHNHFIYPISCNPSLGISIDITVRIINDITNIIEYVRNAVIDPTCTSALIRCEATTPRHAKQIHQHH